MTQNMNVIATKSGRAVVDKLAASDDSVVGGGVVDEHCTGAGMRY